MLNINSRDFGKAASEAFRTTAPLLSVRDLSVAFRDGRAWREVLHHLSLDLWPRETLAIVGESGSGKSVTALSVMGLLPEGTSRISGRIQFGGQDLVVAHPARLDAVRGNEIAMIFQEPMTSLNPVLTVGYQIGEVLRRHRGLDRRAAGAEAARLLDRVHVPAAASRVRDYPHQFSGGMRQRVMIAMALACRPRILIADEPTTALDVTIQAQILDLIRELQCEEDMAVLFITHDMGVVAEMADRTLVIYEGRSVETGDTETIFARPVQPYTRALLSAVPRLGALAAQSAPEPFTLVDPKTGARKTPATVIPPVDGAAPPLLRVEGLKVHFDIHGGPFGRVSDQVRAVDDVSFEIRPGEALALVGESGSGKSTIGKAIVGLVAPTAGTIRFEGEDVTSARGRRHRLQRMQIVFQDPFASLDPRQSVGAAIAEPLLAHRLATRRDVAAHVAEALRKVGLDPDAARRFPHEFSGGQRQRICFARVLGLQPRLIVADESVSALDVSVKARVINLMMELQADLNLAYLFISHDLAVVERISHRIAVMHRGKIVETGRRDTVLRTPGHAYTRQLLAAVPVPDPAARKTRRTQEAAAAR